MCAHAHKYKRFCTHFCVFSLPFPLLTIAGGVYSFFKFSCKAKVRSISEYIRTGLPVVYDWLGICCFIRSAIHSCIPKIFHSANAFILHHFAGLEQAIFAHAQGPTERSMDERAAHWCAAAEPWRNSVGMLVAPKVSVIVINYFSALVIDAKNI